MHLTQVPSIIDLNAKLSESLPKMCRRVKVDSARARSKKNGIGRTALCRIRHDADCSPKLSAIETAEGDLKVTLTFLANASDTRRSTDVETMR